MKIIKSVSECQEWRKALENQSLGFAPTMGALHQGHASLFERCRKENDVVVASIFLNPVQFDNKNDFEKYPSSLENDVKICEKAGVDFLFSPQASEMYHDDYRYRVTENSLSKKLCGQSRPGHFDGVLTVVMKLFNLIQPTKAYFGEKDFQQLQLIKGMVESFFIPLEIVACPTVREESGLAMSSRNRRLSAKEISVAPVFYKILKNEKNLNAARELLEKEGFKVDYLKEIQNRRYAAVFLGEVRLIDNVEVKAKGSSL